MIQRLKERARALEAEAHALRLACRDRRVPWHAKLLVACVAAYALSPIDLIPDFIPLLGHVDDLVLIPLGVLAVRRMIPQQVLEECRERARAERSRGRPVSHAAAVAIVVLWVLGASAASLLLARWLR